MKRLNYTLYAIVYIILIGVSRSCLRTAPEHIVVLLICLISFLFYLKALSPRMIDCGHNPKSLLNIILFIFLNVIVCIFYCFPKSKNSREN